MLSRRGIGDGSICMITGWFIGKLGLAWDDCGGRGLDYKKVIDYNFNLQNNSFVKNCIGVNYGCIFIVMKY